MPNVNLIAEQRAQYRKNSQRTRIWFFVMIAVCGMSVAGAGSMLLGTEAKKSELRDLQAQFDKQSPIRDEIAKNQSALGLLQPRLTSLSSARQATEKWTTVLNHISTNLPPGTFLTLVRSQLPNDPSKPVEFDLTGMSLEQNLVGTFMISLQNCTELTGVTLKYTEEKRAQQGTGLEFSIVSQIEGTEDVKERSSEEKKS